MLRPTPAFVALVVLFASPALGAGTSRFFDAAGDESVHIVRQNAMPVPDCDAPEADVRALTIMSTDEFVVVTMTLAGLGALEADCGPVDVEAERSVYDASLQEPYPNDPMEYVNGILLSARIDSAGWDGCARVYLANGSRSVGCVGGFAAGSTEIAWTVPLADSTSMWIPQDPVALTAIRVTSSYDLRGIVVEPRGGARVDLTSALSGSSFASVRDTIYPDSTVTL